MGCTTRTRITPSGTGYTISTTRSGHHTNHHLPPGGPYRHQHHQDQHQEYQHQHQQEQHQYRQPPVQCHKLAKRAMMTSTTTTMTNTTMAMEEAILLEKRMDTTTTTTIKQTVTRQPGARDRFHHWGTPLLFSRSRVFVEELVPLLGWVLGAMGAFVVLKHSFIHLFV